jgi:hypothetical protein
MKSKHILLATLVLICVVSCSQTLDLGGVDLSGAILEGAILDNANLRWKYRGITH